MKISAWIPNQIVGIKRILLLPLLSLSLIFLVLSTTMNMFFFENVHAQQSFPYPWTEPGYVACRAGIMAACGALVAAGATYVIAQSGGTATPFAIRISGAVFSACNSGIGHMVCEHTLPQDQKSLYSTAEGLCKAGSAFHCDIAADLLCGGTPLENICSFSVGEVCEAGFDALVCDLKIMDYSTPPSEGQPPLCDPNVQSCPPPEQCDQFTGCPSPQPVDCSIMSHPSCPPPETPPPTCDPNVQSCPPPQTSTCDPSTSQCQYVGTLDFYATYHGVYQDGSYRDIQHSISSVPVAGSIGPIGPSSISYGGTASASCSA
jgi:hypothetical protein